MFKVKSSVYFRNCDKTTINPVEGIATGSIPSWLEGTLIRNGPGIQKVGSYEYQHAFDGLAVLHRVRIVDGKAVYSNGALDSDTYRQNMAAQRIVVSEFGTRAVPDPCAKIFSSLKTEFEEGQEKPSKPPKDNCSVSVGYYGDQLYAMAESAEVRRIHPDNLLSIGDKTVISDFVAINTASAHPHVLANGNVINFGQHYANAKGPHYSFFEVPPKFHTSESSFADAKKIAEIPVLNKSAPAYIHSFGITKDKIILIEAPLGLHLSELFTKDGKRSSTVTPMDAFHWDSTQKTRFTVVSMETGEKHPIVYETDKLFTFHHINAYEKKGHLIIDVAGYDTGAVIPEFVKSTVHKIFNSGGSGRRYILPLAIPEGKSGNLITLKNTKATATVREGNNAIVDIQPEVFFDHWFDFPRINYKFNGLKYRYMYGVTSSIRREQNQALPEPDTLVKIDVKTGNILSWKEKNVITAEPIFVANPTAGNGKEDDGVIIVLLLHSNDPKKTTLLVLNAKDFEEVARVEFHGEGTVPGTFHGQWANERDQLHMY